MAHRSCWTALLAVLLVIVAHDALASSAHELCGTDLYYEYKQRSLHSRGSNDSGRGGGEIQVFGLCEERLH